MGCVAEALLQLPEVPFSRADAAEAAGVPAGLWLTVGLLAADGFALQLRLRKADKVRAGQHGPPIVFMMVISYEILVVCVQGLQVLVTLQLPDHAPVYSTRPKGRRQQHRRSRNEQRSALCGLSLLLAQLTTATVPTLLACDRLRSHKAGSFALQLRLCKAEVWGIA
jgi:hypothetical protein